MSQFSYYPLVWICHRRSINHKKAPHSWKVLKNYIKNKNSTFEELLHCDGSFTIRKQNLQLLAIEIFKIPKNSARTIFYDIFQKNEQNIYFSETQLHSKYHQLKRFTMD